MAERQSWEATNLCLVNLSSHGQGDHGSEITVGQRVYAWMLQRSLILMFSQKEHPELGCFEDSGSEQFRFLMVIHHHIGSILVSKKWFSLSVNDLQGERSRVLLQSYMIARVIFNLSSVTMKSFNAAMQ